MISPSQIPEKRICCQPKILVAVWKKIKLQSVAEDLTISEMIERMAEVYWDTKAAKAARER